MDSLRRKKPYPYNDQVTFELNEEGDIRLRIISNEKGIYADLRKYYMDKPTQKGIRMPIEVFERIYKAYIKNESDKKDEENEKNVSQEINKNIMFPKKIKK